MAEGGISISHALNTLLDCLGLDEDQRQARMRCQRMKQLLESWEHESVKSESRFLFSGSTYETTTIHGLSSDLDVMYVKKEDRVIEDIKDWKADGVPMIMMDSSECYKAYVRLYLLSSKYSGPEYTNLLSTIEPFYADGTTGPYFEVDKTGRILITTCDKFCASEMPTPFNTFAEQHGPAVTAPENLRDKETDFVFTLQCESFPRDAVGWKTRQTPLTRTRISPAIIDEINHCYLVGVGNKASATPHLEWRLSFSHIENKLVHNWNNTQYKCYVMMKFIQKDLIKPQVPDALCSYHYKTIMMWMNEEYPSEFFVETNFEKCLLSCLNNLAEAVRRKSLPHYFVDGCNLFYPKISEDPVLSKNLTKIIRDTLSSWPYCLCSITRCNLGNMIKQYLSQPTSLTGICTSVHQKRRREGFHYELIWENEVIISQVRHVMDAINSIEKCVNDRIFLLSDLLQRSSQSDDDSKQFINIVVKDSFCNLALELTRQGKSMGNKNALKSLKLGVRLMKRCLMSCGIETGLKVAAEFVTTGNYHQAFRILDRVENQIKPYTQFTCEHYVCLNDVINGIKEAVYDNKPSLADFYHHYCKLSVTYNWREMSHVPKGLVYEMFRTTSVSPVLDPWLYYWHYQAVIHCPVYLYYLRFLYHQRQGQDAHRQVAIDNMTWATREISKAPRTHEETNHNIIGYCHKTVGDMRRAYKEYRKSLEKEKYNNAVLWHLAVLLRGKIRGDQ